MGGFGVFVPHFHNGKCYFVADGEMVPIRMRKLDNISVRQTYRWKARFVGFWCSNRLVSEHSTIAVPGTSILLHITNIVCPTTRRRVLGDHGYRI